LSISIGAIAIELKGDDTMLTAQTAKTSWIKRLTAVVLIAGTASLVGTAFIPTALADTGSSSANHPSGHSGSPNKHEAESRSAFPNQKMPTPGHNRHHGRNR
jgi:hypothetical protein